MKRLLTIPAVLLLAASGYAVDPTAYVVNTLGESYTKIRLADGAISNPGLPLGSDLGSSPNQLVIRGDRGYAVCSGTDELHVINLTSDNTIAFVPFPAGSNPYWMVIYDSVTAYVTNLTGNSMSRVNLRTNTIETTDSIGQAPSGIVVANRLLWIVESNYDFDQFLTNEGAVIVYDPSGDSVLTRIPVGHNPQFIESDLRGDLHVVCTGDYVAITGVAYRIDGQTRTVIDSISLGGFPGQIRIGPDDIAYVAAGGFVTSGEVYSYDANSGALLHGATNPLLVSQGCIAAVPFQDSSLFATSFIDFVNRIDSGGTPLVTYGVGDGPVHLDFNYVVGDANGSFSVTVADLTYVVNWLFNGGPDPIWPRWRANMNGDFSFSVADLTYAVAYLFSGGPAPRPGPTWPK